MHSCTVQEGRKGNREITNADEEIARCEKMEGEKINSLKGKIVVHLQGSFHQKIGGRYNMNMITDGY